MTQRDLLWRYWPLLPLYPYGKRRTLRQEVLKNTIWTFDQVQGIFYVVVPIRMTVVRLETGGLLVYAPIAPTPECVRLVRELEAEHGAVKSIVLPTISVPLRVSFPPQMFILRHNNGVFPLIFPSVGSAFPPSAPMSCRRLPNIIPLATSLIMSFLALFNLV